MPKIIKQSISILSDAGLGMAMFSLGKSHHLLKISYVIVRIFFFFWVDDSNSRNRLVNFRFSWVGSFTGWTIRQVGSMMRHRII